jgi:epoxyqueuosine reductase QueG
LARYLEVQYGAKVANIPLTYPFEIRYDRKGVADFSHRHAAIAAGLGVFGRHNLVIHPRFGTRVLFVSIITDLALAPSPKVEEDCCTHCNLCVENCPSGALDVEGKTDVMKCLSHSQPYGLGAQIKFWDDFIDSPPEAQKDLVRSERFARLRQSAYLGNQYMCFNCLKSCPVGV